MVSLIFIVIKYIGKANLIPKLAALKMENLLLHFPEVPIFKRGYVQKRYFVILIPDPHLEPIFACI